MKNLLFRYVFVIAAVLSLCAFQKASLEHVVSKALMEQDAKEIAKHFNSSISLQLIDKESVTTKYQAELGLADFFQNNKIVKVAPLKAQESSTNKSYFIFEITTVKKKFNLMVKTIELKDDVYISEFKIN